MKYKSDDLFMAVELVKGPADTGKTDKIEFSKSGLRTADGIWWSHSNVVNYDGDMFVLPFAKLRKILRTIPDEEIITMTVKSPYCVVSCAAANWTLNIKDDAVDATPEFEDGIQHAKGAIQGEGTVISNGYDLAEAIKALKHIVRTDLSRPGLLTAWANDDEELIIGDGSRLGGRKCGVSGVQIPVQAVVEIMRILSVRPTETLTWIDSDSHLIMNHAGGTFVSLKPREKFEEVWYGQVLKSLDNTLGTMSMSLSDTKKALEQVMITAEKMSNAVFTAANGKLTIDTQDEHDEKSQATFTADGELGDKNIILDAKLFSEAVDSMVDEMIFVDVCKKAVRVRDSKGWEFLPRKESVNA